MAGSIPAMGSNQIQINMKVRITNGSYGFGKVWVLECYGKSFYLGQDGKVCSRVLGMRPADVVQAIGTREIESEKGNLKLAKLLVNNLGITRSNVNSFPSWQFAAD